MISAPGSVSGRRMAPSSATPRVSRQPRSTAPSRPSRAPTSCWSRSFDSFLDGTGTYRLTMTHTPAAITVSPGDEGGPLTNGATHTGAIAVGDVDVWTFTANAGERIALHVGQISDDRRLPSVDAAVGAQRSDSRRHLRRRCVRHQRCRGAGHGHLPRAGCEFRQRARRHRHVPPDDDPYAGADHGLDPATRAAR